MEEIKKLFAEYSNEPVTQVDKLPQAGSERSYFRVITAGRSVIATYGANTRENETFIYFSEHFRKKSWLRRRYCTRVPTRRYTCRKILGMNLC